MLDKNAKYLKNKKNFLLNTDWFHINFICNFLSVEMDIKRSINEKKFRHSDLDISSRIMSHWVKLGLIEDDRPEGKGWRLFSLSEMIWLHIIIKLRKFGLDLSKIKKVKDCLDLYNEMGNQSKCPLFDFYFLYTFQSYEPVCLIVFDSGESLLARQSDIDIAKQFGGINEEYITIDINKLFNKGIRGKKIEADYLSYNKSLIEKEVAFALHFDDVQSFSLKTINKEEYIFSKELILDSKLEMNRLLSKVRYAKAETVKRDGNIIYKLTIDKKLKKK